VKKRLFALFLVFTLLSSLVPNIQPLEADVGGVTRKITTNFKPGEAGISSDRIFKVGLVWEDLKPSCVIPGDVTGFDPRIEQQILKQYSNYYPGTNSGVTFIENGEMTANDRLAWYQGHTGEMYWRELSAAERATKYRSFAKNTSTMTQGYYNAAKKPYVSKLTGKSVEKAFKDLTFKELAAGDWKNFYTGNGDRGQATWNYILSGYSIDNGIKNRIDTYTGAAALKDNPTNKELVRAYVLKRVDMLMGLREMVLPNERAMYDAAIEAYVSGTDFYKKPVNISVEVMVRLVSNQNFGTDRPVISAVDAMEYIFAATVNGSLSNRNLAVSTPNDAKAILAAGAAVALDEADRVRTSDLPILNTNLNWGISGFWGKDILRTSGGYVHWSYNSRAALMEQLYLDPGKKQKGVILEVPRFPIDITYPAEDLVKTAGYFIINGKNEFLKIIPAEQESARDNVNIPIKFKYTTAFGKVFWEKNLNSNPRLKLTITRDTHGPINLKQGNAPSTYSVSTPISPALLHDLVNGNKHFLMQDAIDIPLAEGETKTLEYTVKGEIVYKDPLDGVDVVEVLPTTFSFDVKVSRGIMPDEIAEYKSSPSYWAELKQGSPGNETFDAMTGTPTTRNLYFSTGGSEFIVDIKVKYYGNETATRNYTDTYTPVICDVQNPCTVHCHGHTSGDPPTTTFCGSCCHCGCGHNAPCKRHYVNDTYTWSQQVTFDTVKIEDVHVWKIDRAKLNGMAELTGTDEVSATVVQGDPTVFYNKADDNTSAEGRIRYSLKRSEDDDPSWTQPSNNSCTGHTTNNNATNLTHKNMTGTATAISDFLILQTSSGDQSVMYFEKTSPTGKTTDTLAVPKTSFDTMWYDNPDSAANWAPEDINIGGYNGDYRNPANKYIGSGDGATVPTIFDTQEHRLNRPSRPNNMRLMKTGIDVIDTIPNREYIVGDSSVFYELLDFSFGTGNIYNTSVDSEYGSRGDSFPTAYSDDHGKINDVVMHNPVSTQYSIPIPLDDSRDQRTSGSRIGGNPNPQNNVCPGNPADCEFRRLACTYAHEYMTDTVDWKDPNVWNMTGNITWDETKQAWKAVGYATMYLKPEYAAPVNPSKAYTISATAMVENNQDRFFYWGGDRLNNSKAHLEGIGGTYDYSATNGHVIVPSGVWTTYKKVGKTGTANNYNGWNNDGVAYYRVGGLLNYSAASTQVTYVKDIKFNAGGTEHTAACYTQIQVHSGNNKHNHISSCATYSSNYYTCGNTPVNAGGYGTWYHPSGCSYSYETHNTTSTSSCTTCGHSCGAIQTPISAAYHSHTGSCPYIPAGTWNCNNLPLNTHTCAPVTTVGGTPVLFNYTGTTQSYTATKTGNYKLEVWGAQGGSSAYNSNLGMPGSYATGMVTLNAGETIYIYVGGQGGTYDSYAAGGWNGGGSGSQHHGGAGGGATDIRKGGNDLSNRIIVAGGGGGAGQENDQGFYPTPGGSGSSTGQNGAYDNGGGGGGYQGGLTGQGGPDGMYNGSNDQGGSAGSSHTGTLTSPQIILYNAIMPNPAGGTILGKSGHGTARITPESTTIPSTCVDTTILNCAEPHHTGSHYDLSNAICYQACNNNANHNHKEKVLIPGQGEFTPGNFINLDYGFQLYFPNIGDFYGNGAYGVSETSYIPGRGFVDNMDTTEWTRQKSVELDFDVIYNGQMYMSGEEIFLTVNQDTFNFYCPLENREAMSAKIIFRAYAINGTGMDNDDTTNRQRQNQMGAMHSAYKDTYIDIVGRIGNLVIEDTGDFRYSNFFKQAVTPVEWIVPNVVRKTNESLQNHIIGDNTDVRGLSIGTATKWLNTYGKLSHIEQQPVSFPLSPEKNNTDALKKQPYRIGYDTYLDVSTIGNYYDDMQIIPYYYWLDLETKQIKQVDVYMDVNGEYKPINLHGACVPGWNPNIVYDNVANLNWEEQAARRNYSPLEKAATERVAQEMGKEAQDGTLQWLRTPAGKFFKYGNSQLLQLKDRNRTFIGSSKTYGADKNPGTRIPEVKYEYQAQRWHFTLGLPSSAVVVERGLLPIQANIDNLRKNTGVIIMAADIKAVGETYFLQYDHSGGNDPINIGGTPYPLNGIPHAVIGVLSANKSSKDDLEVRGTH
jgi:hypothetical protein